MNKKLVVLGGGTGQSVLLKGLKQFPFDITAVVSVCDDGKSTGKIREEFNIPAVGDIRRVLIALSETEDIVERLVNYRFSSKGDFNGHTVGNLILAALTDIGGNLSSGIKLISDILNMKGEVLPLTDECVTLMGEMEDGEVIEGEHHITLSPKKIKKVFYKEKAKANKEVLDKIKESDAIILSMGSLYTSIIPNLLSDEVVDSLIRSKAKKMYVCNIMSEHGETDNYKVSDCIKKINSYVQDNMIDVVLVNDEVIPDETKKRYLEEIAAPIEVDFDVLEEMGVEVLGDKLIEINDKGEVRHNPYRTALAIFNYIVKELTE